jgi:drug/metabolite transporter (DMT)-like permease
MSNRTGAAAGVMAVFTASFAFSWGFVLVKAIALPPVTIAFFRVLIGAAVLVIASSILRPGWPSARTAVLGAGLCFGLHQLAFITATHETSIAVVTLLGALQPLVVSLVSRRTLGERVPPALYGWSLLAASGVGLVVYANLGSASRSLFGDLLACANLVLTSAFYLFSKRARDQGASTLSLTTATLVIALILISPALAFTPPAAPIAPRDWTLLVILALVPGNGHLLLNWAHPRISAALGSLTLASIPLLASVWAWLVFDQPYTIRHALGMLVVLVAIEGGRRQSR